MPVPYAFSSIIIRRFAMEQMIAYCGLVCTDCPAYAATQQDSDAMRKEVVEKWSSDQSRLKIEDINCDGCLSVGKLLFKFCNDCEVRICGSSKNVQNCAHCDDYACSKLEKLWDMISAGEAKERLENIREELNE
jgi:hypothetical protein